MKKMSKRWLAAIIAAFMLGSTALAETYQGSTAAAYSVRVEVDGELDEVLVQAGAWVKAGEVLATVKSEAVYAEQDGTVARIQVEAGAEADGTVMEVAPVSLYRIYCTVEEAYSAAENMLVHSGETLYVRCTADGTHRAVGLVTQIEGAQYQLLTTGGELYVGETVYLYRDADFSSDQRVGIGTVIANAAQVYEAQGRIREICVSEGEYVERGEKLYEISTGAQDEICADVSGIVTQVPGGEGAEESAFVLVPEEALWVELQLDEVDAAEMQTGDAVGLIYAGDSQEQLWPGTIAQIARTSEESDGTFTVFIAPETPPQRLGQTVQVRTGV